MSDGYLSEIRLFSFGVVPAGWLPCNGQLMQIQQNKALFSLLGNRYGGDGQTTFALPDLRGRTPVAASDPQINRNYVLATSGGVETVTLVEAQMAPHNHSFAADGGPANANNPMFAGGGNNLATPPAASPIYAPPPPSGSGMVTMAPQSIDVAGAGAAHPNMQPFLVLNFCIAVTGVYPSFD